MREYMYIYVCNYKVLRMIMLGYLHMRFDLFFPFLLCPRTNGREEICPSKHYECHLLCSQETEVNITKLSAWLSLPSCCVRS